MDNRGFLKLHCLHDDRMVAVRVETVSRVFDMEEEIDDGAVRPSHTLIVTNDGDTIRCTESFDEIMDAIGFLEL